MKKIYQYTADEILKQLDTSAKDGLSEHQAQRRIEKNGENKLPQKEATSAIKTFLAQLKSPLMFVILLAVVFSFLIGHWTDAIFILVVILINAIVGFIQENKAEKVLRQLSQSVKFSCRVIRDGRKREILSEKLAVGDIIVINSGDKIPADGRIIETSGLKINEAMLTGEWMPIEKKVKAFSEETSLAERKNMVFMGSIVEEGKGIFVVSDIGLNTEIGKISKMVKSEVAPQTPLQKKFLKISQQMVVGILGAIGLFSLIYIWRGETLYNVFITAIALVVSAIPEGLLPAITIVLVFAMKRLAKKKALIRKLNATETMGSVSVICMDKTGTLTKGEMSVSHILTGDKELLSDKELTNIYEPHSDEAHLKVLEIATLVNDAYVENPGKELADWIIRGRSTDKALLFAGIQAGIKRKNLENSFELIEEVDFNSERKYAMRVYKTKQDKIIVKFMGAPEKVIKRSKNILLKKGKVAIDSQHGKELMTKLDKLTNQGLRILACAQKEVSLEKYQKMKKDGTIKKDLNLIGFVALKDPLRSNVKRSLKIAKGAGIKTVVITGDHRNTAKAIVNELGEMVKDEEILEGKNIEQFSESQLRKVVKKIKIFARVSPKHKIRIVKAWQYHQEVVAMVGDGINDAPALRAADVGISVGSGADITKEVADIVLLDNSFSVIIKAIEQGRVARENIRRVVIYLTADDFSELFLFFFAVIFGLPFPLYPVQILWINLVEDSFPNIALTTENNVKGIMKEKPSKLGEPLLSQAHKQFMIITFVVTSLAASCVFYGAYKFSGNIEHARTITFALVAFDSLAFAYAVRSFRRSIFSWNVFGSRWLNISIVVTLLILLLGLYLPVMQEMLKVVTLGFVDWLLIVGISFLEILVLELFKKKVINKK